MASAAVRLDRLGPFAFMVYLTRSDFDLRKIGCGTIDVC